MLNWAKMAGFAAMLAVALASSIHWAFYHQETTNDHVIETFTAVLAIATLMLMFATVGLVFLSQQQVRDARINQRAYVKMSHAPPGLDVKGNTGLLYIDMAIKNYGQTPADITDIFFKPVVLSHNFPLPKAPDYSGVRTVFPKAFLVANDELFIFHVLRIDPEQIVAVKDFSSDLYIIGYVDYIDKFGDQHRGGYARKYAYLKDDRNSYDSDAAFAKRNNLIFVTDAGYNYDRLFKRSD